MNAGRRLLAAGLLLVLAASTGGNTLARSREPRAELESLTKGESIAGFRVDATYLDDTDAPFGARFVHERTGFTLDYLRMQSVPQAFLWVTTYPTSDKGEPHTQEHLLLGKGAKGRAVASLEDLALVRSSAFTTQTRTNYHFHTGAGPDVFFRVFEARLDALLHPTYTDEEIRREVRNFGVAESPSDRSLRLEEKGTVYNEMVSSFERPIRRLWRAANAKLYGVEHPLALSSGGYPSAIREMTPDDIRRFHREHYFLANMGVVAALPK
jgi:Zn-dependent M16 (insulinase) family peptidase